MPGFTYRRFLYITFLLALLPQFSSAQVLINEIMYDPRGADNGREWVEIYNTGSREINILTGGSNSSWRFVDSSQHTMAVTKGDPVLLPGSYAVIVDNTFRFLRDWPSYSGIILESSVSLNNLLGDVAVLTSKNGQVQDRVTYYSSQGASGDGNSLQFHGGSVWRPGRPNPGNLNSEFVIKSTLRSGSELNEHEYSTHYGANPVSDATPSITLDIGAGRERIGSVGSPMEFKVETSLVQKDKNFLWNFGDGTEAGGSTLSHTYKYPGDYVVILNASLKEGEAISRINVKIIDPQLSISFADSSRIEIKNGSSYEVNLFGRAVVVGNNFFVFPKDTIIKAGQSISFGSDITHLKPSSAYDVYIVVLGDTEHPQYKVKIEEQRLKHIENIKFQISELQRKMNELFIRR